MLVVGFLLFLAQFTATTVYHGLLNHVLDDRAELDCDLSQIQGTLDYLNRTSADFLGDEQRLHSKYGLPLPDEEERSLGTGGSMEPKSKLLMETSPVFEKMANLKEEANRLHGKLDNNSGAFSEELTRRRAAERLTRFGDPVVQADGRVVSQPISPTQEQLDEAVSRSQNSNEIYLQLFKVATQKTALADVRYDDSGARIDPTDSEEDELENDSAVVIVKQD